MRMHNTIVHNMSCYYMTKCFLHCTDVNECDEGIHNCHENANCSDVVGGFNCICNTGFTGNGTFCESKWYHYRHRILITVFTADVNECDEGIHNCHENANCSDVVGGFNCICSSGFTGNGTFCESKWYHYRHRVYRLYGYRNADHCLYCRCK